MIKGREKRTLQQTSTDKKILQSRGEKHAMDPQTNNLFYKKYLLCSERPV